MSSPFQRTLAATQTALGGTPPRTRGMLADRDFYEGQRRFNAQQALAEINSEAQRRATFQNQDLNRDKFNWETEFNFTRDLLPGLISAGSSLATGGIGGAVMGGINSRLFGGGGQQPPANVFANMNPGYTYNPATGMAEWRG